MVTSERTGCNGASLCGSTDAGPLTEAVLNVIDIGDKWGARCHGGLLAVVVHGHPGTIGAWYRPHRVFSYMGEQRFQRVTSRDQPGQPEKGGLQVVLVVEDLSL